MNHIRHLVRAVAPMLLLVVVAFSGTAAHAVRVTPPGGNGSTIANTPPVQEGSPLWTFLVVAAVSVALTLVASRLLTSVRNNTHRRRTTPA